MSDFSAIKDFVLFLIAIYGAGLSTFNFVQTILKDKRKVIVGYSITFPIFGDLPGPNFLQIDVTNIGQRPVTISQINLELPSGQRLANTSQNVFPLKPNTPLPITLKDGETAYCIYSYLDIGKALAKQYDQNRVSLVPLAVDSVGGKHRGKPFELGPKDCTDLHSL